MSSLTDVVRDLGFSNGQCAYCQALSGFYAHGMLSTTMSVQTCQDLIDIGWTRAGFYFYKPDLTRMCCPSYTIRLDVQNFVPRKDQKRALRKLQRYLDGEALSPNHDSSSATQSSPAAGSPQTDSDMALLLQLLLSDLINIWLFQESLSRVDVSIRVRGLSHGQQKRLPKSVFLTSPSCLALFHALRSTPSLKQTTQWKFPEDVAKSIARLFNDTKQNFYQSLLSAEMQSKWRTVFKDITLSQDGGHLNFHMEPGTSLNGDSVRQLLALLHLQKDSAPSSSAMHVDRDGATDGGTPTEAGTLPDDFRRRINRKRRFSIIWNRSSFIPEEFQLFQKYQMSIHKDPPNKWSEQRYERFLVDSPLIAVEAGDGVPAPGFGSFHVQYRIDDRLIAVGVTDVFPRFFSSMYFFWDPDFASLSLGKISAMKEIEWVQSAGTICPSLRYYSMGYYVPSCRKTSYKVDYAPLSILCPLEYVWVPFTDAIRDSILQNSYVPVSEIEPNHEPNAVICPAEVHAPPVITLQKLLIWDECMSLRDWVLRMRDPETSWDDEQIQHMGWILPCVKRALEAWKKIVMAAGDRMVYDCIDFLSYNREESH